MESVNLLLVVALAQLKQKYGHYAVIYPIVMAAEAVKKLDQNQEMVRQIRGVLDELHAADEIVTNALNHPRSRAAEELLVTRLKVEGRLSRD